MDRPRVIRQGVTRRSGGSRIPLPTILSYGTIVAVVILMLSLPRSSPQLRFHVDPPLVSEGWTPDDLLRHYSFKMTIKTQGGQPNGPLQLLNEAADVTVAYQTDATITAYDLRPLVDDRDYFPPRCPLPLATRSILRRHPELEALITKVCGRIDETQMTRLNARVVHENASVNAVAVEFCASADIIGDTPPTANKASGIVRLGLSASPEHRLLAEILAVAVESASDIDVVGIANPNGEEDFLGWMLAGRIDLCISYDEFQPNPAVLPEGEENVLRPLGEAPSGEAVEIRRFDPFGFDARLTLVMRRGHAERLKLSTISDLASWIRERR